MSGGQLSANASDYLAANGMNLAPPPISSDPLVAGMTPIEQLLRVLGLAANLGDPKDNTESIEEHAKRDSKTAEAAAKFPAQDEQASAEMKGVAGQGQARPDGPTAPPDGLPACRRFGRRDGRRTAAPGPDPPAGCPGRPAGHAGGYGHDEAGRRRISKLDKASLSDPLGEFGETTRGIRCRWRRIRWRRGWRHRRHHTDRDAGTTPRPLRGHVAVGSQHRGAATANGRTGLSSCPAAWAACR